MTNEVRCKCTLMDIGAKSAAFKDMPKKNELVLIDQERDFGDCGR